LALAASVLTVGVSAAAASAGGPNTVTVQMTGGQEVPPGSPTASGTFRFQIIPNSEEVCFNLTWKGLDTPTMAHIHKAPADMTGPVVIVLYGMPPVGHSGCRTAKASLIDAIQSHPTDYYVNVHTKKYPDGAIRGQL
jgi:CHRD domain